MRAVVRFGRGRVRGGGLPRSAEADRASCAACGLAPPRGARRRAPAQPRGAGAASASAAGSGDRWAFVGGRCHHEGAWRGLVASPRPQGPRRGPYSAAPRRGAPSSRGSPFRSLCWNAEGRRWRWRRWRGGRRRRRRCGCRRRCRLVRRRQRGGRSPTVPVPVRRCSAWGRARRARATSCGAPCT